MLPRLRDSLACKITLPLSAPPKSPSLRRLPSSGDRALGKLGIRTVKPLLQPRFFHSATMSLSPTTTSDEEQQQEPTYMWMGDDIEDLERYTKGGYHPVNIDDEIYGRYRIVHKLGFGSYSTVWLARDQQLDRFVSLKFLVADTPPNSPEILILRQLSNISGSQLENHPGRPFVLTLLDEFEVQGENGRHHCLVTEALGPSISAVKYESDRNRLPGHISRIVATQCAKGLAYLHSCGVVHGGIYM